MAPIKSVSDREKFRIRIVIDSHNSHQTKILGFTKLTCFTANMQSCKSNGGRLGIEPLRCVSTGERHNVTATSSESRLASFVRSPGPELHWCLTLCKGVRLAARPSGLCMNTNKQTCLVAKQSNKVLYREAQDGRRPRCCRRHNQETRSNDGDEVAKTRILQPSLVARVGGRTPFSRKDRGVGCRPRSSSSLLSPSWAVSGQQLGWGR